MSWKREELRVLEAAASSDYLLCLDSGPFSVVRGSLCEGKVIQGTVTAPPAASSVQSEARGNSQREHGFVLVSLINSKFMFLFFLILALFFYLLTQEYHLLRRSFCSRINRHFLLRSISQLATLQRLVPLVAASTWHLRLGARHASWAPLLLRWVCCLFLVALTPFRGAVTASVTFLVPVTEVSHWARHLSTEPSRGKTEGSCLKTRVRAPLPFFLTRSAVGPEVESVCLHSVHRLQATSSLGLRP